MNKALALRTLMLLSALESWGFAVGKPLPDHTLDALLVIVEELKAEVLT